MSTILLGHLVKRKEKKEARREGIAGMPPRNSLLQSLGLYRLLAFLQVSYP